MSRWPNLAQKEYIFESLDYEPNPDQRPFHQSTANLLQLVGAEGAGKSLVTAMELAACCLWSDLIYLIGQTYENCHREFEYLSAALISHHLARLSDVSMPRQGSWSMKTLTM